MKILIFTPKYLPHISGNTTTVERLINGLNDKGVNAKVIDLSAVKDGKAILKISKEFQPDILHEFHAFKSWIAFMVAKNLNKPLIVTVTGTDANHDLFNKERRKKVLEVLDYSSLIVVFHESIREKLMNNAGTENSKIRIIKQSVLLKKRKFDLREKLNLKNDDFVFLILAGIRGIKYHFFYVDEFKKLFSEYKNIKLVISGPVLDQEFADKLLSMIQGIECIYYLDGIDHDKIYSAIKSADVVMNASLSEGGMSNSVLEAMYCGRAVLASNIDGNKSVIKDGFNGLLFNNEKEFYEKAELLIKDKKLREQLGRKAKEILSKNFSFEEEIQNYVRIYDEALSSR